MEVRFNFTFIILQEKILIFLNYFFRKKIFLNLQIRIPVQINIKHQAKANHH